MDTGQATTVMKKNALSISLGVAALVALVVTWLVINPMINDLDKQAEERAARQEKAESLLTQSRPNVQVSLSSAADQERPLNMFPTRAVIENGKRTIEQVERQASSVLEAAVEANRQVPLLQDDYDTAAEAWPLERTRDDLARDEYQRAYREYLNADDLFMDGRYPPSSLPGLINATRPPSQDEVAQAMETREARMQAQEPTDESGNVLAEDFEERLTAAKANLATQMKFARAREHLFYLDANTETSGLDVHELAEAEQPTAEDVFGAQMELWVQENVLDNLYRANFTAVQSLTEEEQNLLNAPVKHILGIEVHGLLESDEMESRPRQGQPPQNGGMGPEDYYGEYMGGEGMMDPSMMDPGLMGGAEGGFEGGQNRGTNRPNRSNNTRRSDQEGGATGLSGPARAGGTGTGEDDDTLPEVDLPNDPSADVNRQFAYSMTGRLPHTPVYDLMRFNLRLRCEAAAVPYVLNQLQAGSLITVLNVDVRTVDLALAASQGYVYGDEPVVELDLQGEMVFLRSWTAALMPTSIKDALANWGGDDEGEDLAF